MSALRSIRVLELAESVAGEFCGKLLADFGAEVIKVERPGHGSPTRHVGPFAPRGADPERSGLFAWLNTNKSSVELALQEGEERGDDALAGLLGAVDVVIDDHAEGWLQARGLGAAACEENYPHLVVCAISAFGADAPEERRHAQDINVFHASGWGYHTPSGAADAQPPLNGAGRFLPAYEAGLEGAVCVASALFERARSGLGRFIDVSAQATLASRVDYVLAQMAAGDMPVSADRGAFDLAGPAGIFPCREGFAYIWMSAPTHWDALRQILGDPAWMHSFPDNWLERECTPERVARCRQGIAEWLATQDKHEAAAVAQELGLTLVPVNDASDLQASPQYQHRGFFAEVDHPEQGVASYPTVPYQLSETPARIDRPAPLLGQHTQDVLESLRADNSDRVVSPEPGSATDGPLAGVRVLELTKVWAGPYVGKLLAFLGAEVIRVESEGSLDVTRTFGVDDINNAPGFHAVNPQKLSVQINMKSEEGIALLLDLVRESDIVVENLRPGAAERLGLDYERLKSVNERIVYIAMGMYGSTGPLAYQTGYAPCFVALGGPTSLVGYEGEAPSGMNVRYADSTFGTLATFAGLVALLHARDTGRGQLVDVSAVESMSVMVADSIMDYTLNGVIHSCGGNRHQDMAPHGVFPCADGEWISIAVASDEAWLAFARFMERADLVADTELSTVTGRKAREQELDDIVSRWTVERDAAALVAELQRRGIAAAKSQSSLDMVSDAHLWARGFYRDVVDSSGKARTTTGPGWKMSREIPITHAAPRLGEHTARVLEQVLGLSAEEQALLAGKGVTR